MKEATSEHVNATQKDSLNLSWRDTQGLMPLPEMIASTVSGMIEILCGYIHGVRTRSGLQIEDWVPDWTIVC